jgi:hypothetical protein
LRERGVPPATLTGLECNGLDDWQAAKVLGQWLLEHPRAHVALLCDRFDSHRQRWIINSVLSAADARRVRVCAIPGKKFNEANWQSGGLEGLLGFLNASITLSHAMVMGSGPSDRQEADLSQFVETQAERDNLPQSRARSKRSTTTDINTHRSNAG